MTVIITTHNRPHLLERAINSVLNQSLQPSEILIIDDGSNIKPKLPKHKLIRYIYKENKGISSARNQGIKEAKHEWLAFLDDDDEWEKAKLKVQYTFHQQNPSIKASFTDERWYFDGEEIKVPKKYQKNTQDLFEKALRYCFIAPSSAMIHKSVFEDIGLFDESLKICEDYDMWLRLLNSYEFAFIDKKLIKKHAHDGDQLGLSLGQDSFRIEALVKLLPLLDEQKSALAHKELRYKLELVYKGAQKHNNQALLKRCEAIYKLISQT